GLNQDGDLALRADEGQRARVDVPRNEHANRGRHDHPTEPPADDPHRSATQPHAGAHRRSWRMNCAIGEPSVRSSTNRIALFGTSMRWSGLWSSLPRRTSRVEGVALASELSACCK